MKLKKTSFDGIYKSGNALISNSSDVLLVVHPSFDFVSEELSVFHGENKNNYLCSEKDKHNLFKEYVGRALMKDVPVLTLESDKDLDKTLDWYASLGRVTDSYFAKTFHGEPELIETDYSVLKDFLNSFNFDSVYIAGGYYDASCGFAKGCLGGAVNKLDILTPRFVPNAIYSK